MFNQAVSLLGNRLFQRETTAVIDATEFAGSVGPAVDINRLLGDAERWSQGFLAEGPVESNERYYRRRAVEERMAAQRAVTEQARTWHAKLAEDFAAKSSATAAIITQTALSA